MTACVGGDIVGLGGESIENITVNGQGGNDDLSAKGGNGTGRPAGQFCFDLDPVTPGIQRLDDQSPDITLDGGSGDDFLQGSECGDTLIGGPGIDQIQGNGPTAAVGCLQNDSLGRYEALTGGLFGDLVDLSARHRSADDRVQRERDDHDHPGTGRLRLRHRGRDRLGR